MRHYKVDMVDARRRTRRDARKEREEARTQGWYSYGVLEYVPIGDIEKVPVWRPERIDRIREALRDGTPLPAITASPDATGVWRISDGIHRYNASVEAGMTHVPSIRHVVVDVPEQKEPPLPERPKLVPGSWVRFFQAERGRQRWALVDEYLTHRVVDGVVRRQYALMGVRNGGPDFLGDYWDDEFAVPSAQPPPRVRRAVEAFRSGFRSRSARRVALRYRAAALSCDSR